MMFAATALLALSSLASAQLFTGTNYRATVYYDVDENYGTDVCGQSAGGPFMDNWAKDTINMGNTFCQDSTSTAFTLDSLDTNRIVAMDWNMMSSDPAKWCGKEVQIFRADGSEVTIPEGPFVLYDACAACMTSDIIDLSAKAFTAIEGKCGNNPEGLTVKILDNNVSPSGGAGGGRAPAPTRKPSPTTSAASSPTKTPASSTTESPASSSAKAPVSTATESPVSPDTTTSSKAVETSSYSIRGSGAWWSSSSSSKPTPSVNNLAAVPSSSDSPATTTAEAESSVAESSVAAPAESESPAPPAQAPPASSPVTATASCTFGKWQCAGNDLQICTYQSATTIDWETIAHCANECSLTQSGSVRCQ